MRPDILCSAIGEVIRTEIKSAIAALPPPIPGEPGQPGEPGPAGRPGDAGRDGVDGKDGASVSVDAVAAAICAIPSFKDLVKGDAGARGENGRDGLDGKDGASVSVEAVAAAICAIPAFEVLVKGETGARGDTGPPGADGLGLETQAWVPDAVYREGAFVTMGHGKVYKSIRDTASKPGSSDWQRVGTLGFEFKGVKNEGEQYEDGDIYVDGGSAFLVTKGRGRLLAGRGKDGRDGQRGEDGEPGPHVVAVKATTSALTFAFSDGSVQDAPVEGFDALVNSRAAELSVRAASEARADLRDMVLRCADFAAFQREVAKW